MSIVLQQIVKSYGQSVVIDHLDLNLPSEGIICLTGPSGCGKTTLIRLVAGLEKPDAGMISGVEGKTFSMVFQEDRLLPWLTAAENLDLVLHQSVSKRYLDLVQLGEDSHKYPSELSGGMRRRVALARALAHDSDVLVLDEPFKGLDETLRENMIELVRHERRNRLAYLITHDAYEARRLADLILQFEGPPLRLIK